MSRESYAEQQIPAKGSLDTPYPTSRKLVGVMGVHLTEMFVGEAEVVGDSATGLSAERSADIPAPGTLDYASSNAGDTTQTVTVYGLDGSNNVISETKTLNGTTTVHGAVSFTKVIAAVVSAAHAGTVTVKDTVIPTTLFSIATGTLTKGYLAENLAIGGGHVTVSIDTNVAGKALIVLGTDADGDPVSEYFSMTAAATPIEGAVDFETVTALLLGDIAAARTVSVTGVNAFLGGIPFEPAMVDVHDTAVPLEQRMMPTSSGTVNINLNTGAAAAANISVAEDDPDAGTFKVVLPRAVAPAKHVVHVVCYGIRNGGNGSL